MSANATAFFIHIDELSRRPLYMKRAGQLKQENCLFDSTLVSPNLKKLCSVHAATQGFATNITELSLSSTRDLLQSCLEHMLDCQSFKYRYTFCWAIINFKSQLLYVICLAESVVCERPPTRSPLTHTPTHTQTTTFYLIPSPGINEQPMRDKLMIFGWKVIKFS